MSKLTPTLSGLACFLWVSGWTWMFSKDKNEVPIQDPLPFRVLLDSAQFNAQASFSFELNQALPVVTEHLQPILSELLAKFKGSETVVLRITGVYSNDEVNDTKYANLGLARAEAIKALLLAAGGEEGRIEVASMESANLFLYDGKLTGAVFFQFEENIGMAAEKVPVEKVDVPANHDKAKVFYYKKGDYKVDKRNLDYLNNLRRQLRDNPKLKVLITGYSDEEEEAVSSSVNLAEMRALSVRRYLVDHGTRRAQIQVNAKPGMAKRTNDRTATIQLVGNTGQME